MKLLKTRKNLLLLAVLPVLITIVSARVTAQSDTGNPAVTSTPPVSTSEQKTVNLFAGKVLLGDLQSISGKVLVVNTDDGAAVSVTATEVTKFYRGGRLAYLSQLTVGDRVAIAGAAATDGTFLAREVVAKSKVLKIINKVALMGVVNQISATSFTISSNNQTYEINFNSQTAFEQNGRKVTSAQLLSGATVAAVAIKEDTGVLTGRLVAIMPQTAATPQATPAAKPTP
ncbi:MAG: DUF5666 domain-containing protein [Patescibacteria group bacterium]|nr:DUF5666 domain-containing protein [Patescibacteria group bacterium]